MASADIVSRARQNVERDRRDLFGSDREERRRQALNEERRHDMQEFLENQRRQRGGLQPSGPHAAVVDQRDVSSSALSLPIGGSSGGLDHTGTDIGTGRRRRPRPPPPDARLPSHHPVVDRGGGGDDDRMTLREAFRERERRYQGNDIDAIDDIDGASATNQAHARRSGVANAYDAHHTARPRSHGDGYARHRHQHRDDDDDDDDVERQLAELQRLLRDRRRARSRREVPMDASAKESGPRGIGRSSAAHIEDSRDRRGVSVHETRTDDTGDEAGGRVRDWRDRAQSVDDAMSHGRRSRRSTAYDDTGDGDVGVLGLGRERARSVPAGQEKRSYADELREQIKEKERRKQEEKNLRKAPAFTADGPAAMAFGARDRRRVSKSVPSTPEMPRRRETRSRSVRFDDSDDNHHDDGYRDRGHDRKRHEYDSRQERHVPEQRYHHAQMGDPQGPYGPAAAMGSMPYQHGIPIPFGAMPGGPQQMMMPPMVGGYPTMDPASLFPALYPQHGGAMAGMSAAANPGAPYMMPMTIPSTGAPPPQPMDAAGYMGATSSDRRHSNREDARRREPASKASSHATPNGRGKRPMSYAEELKQQIQNAKERKAKEKRDADNWDSYQPEPYDPWGKGGAGAPMRDTSGHVVADYRALARGDASPEPRMDSPTRTPAPGVPPLRMADDTDTRTNDVPADPQQRSPSHYERTTGGDGMGPTSQEERNREASKKNLTYQEFLKEQVEEKARRAREKKLKEKEEDEKEAKRVAEEQKRLQAVYEEEQRKQKEKEELIKAENDARQREAEEKRKFAAEKRMKDREAAEKREQEERAAALDRALKENLPSPSLVKTGKASIPTSPVAEPVPVAEPQVTPAPIRPRVPSPPIPTMRKGTQRRNPEDDPFNQQGAKAQRQIMKEISEAQEFIRASPDPQAAAAAVAANLSHVETHGEAHDAPPPLPPLVLDGNGAEATTAHSSLTDEQRAMQKQLDEQKRLLEAQQQELEAQRQRLQDDERKQRALPQADTAHQRPQSSRSRPQSSRSRPQSSRSRPRSSRPLSSRHRPSTTSRRTATVSSAVEQALQDFESAPRHDSQQAPTQPPPPPPPLREKTTELVDPPAADLHDSVHEPSNASVASPSLPASDHAPRDVPLDRVAAPSNTSTRVVPPRVDDGAKDQLMGQLQTLRKKLEGEQHKIHSEIEANSAQYSKMAMQARRRQRRQEKEKEVNMIMENAVRQAEDLQQLPPSEVASRRDSFKDSKRPVMVRRLGREKSGGDAGLAADVNALDDFNRMKYAGLVGNGQLSKKSLLSTYPEPAQSAEALDKQQQALLDAQEKDLKHLRALQHVPGDVTGTGADGIHGTALDRANTGVSFASFSSLNVDALAAKNDERLRRLKNADAGAHRPADPDAILDTFLNRESDHTEALLSPRASPVRTLHALDEGGTAVGNGDVQLPAESQFRKPGSTHSSAML